MEMIDVLQKLKEIAETKPELVKDAVESVEKTNPKVDESRMKDYLHSEAEKLSREELANIVGTATESVIRLLSEFKKDKLIAVEGRSIKLLNISELTRTANIFD